MSTLATLFRRTAHYVVGTGSVIIAGLVSYPLFTRILTVEEYGVMGLIGAILLGGVAVAKLGLQNSLVRLWPEHEHSEESRGRFASTFFFAELWVSLGCAALVAALLLLLRDRTSPLLRVALLVAAWLIPVRAFFSFATNFMRAREQSRAFALLVTCNSFGATGLAILFVVGLHSRLPGYYFGILLAEAAVAVAGTVWVLRGFRLDLGRSSGKLLREALHFGIPLTVFEFATILLFMGDRLLINLFRGQKDLGLYTAAFTLSWQISSALLVPIDNAVTPMYTGIYVREGATATRDFLGRATRAYAMLVLPMAAGLFAVHKDLLVLLASAKYQDASLLAPVLMCGFFCYSSRAFLGAGLFLSKRSRVTGMVALGGALLNLGFNFALVPRYGIHGSATATLISQLLIAVALAALGLHYFRFRVGFAAVLRYAACALLMGLVASQIHVHPWPLQLGLRVIAGVLLYFGLVVAIDQEARGWLVVLRRRLRSRLAGRGATP